MNRQLITISLILFCISASAQNYPKGYFRNPLNTPIFLAGNFGECRPNHFHSGLDIKTNGKENLPVYAAADGYISRIKMEPGGFGHGLYLTHPNGYTTLYAHLNDFMPELQRYVKAEQYKNESWTVDLSLNPSQFPVKKGQLIAWSGNTGSSTAPHLHFEIRDNKTEHPLNPMLFGFDIKDDIAPVPSQIAVYNMRKSVYEQTPLMTKLKKKGTIYATDTIISNSALAAIGIATNDFMNGSENTLTFYKADIYLDSTLQGVIKLDDIGYDVTRYQHAYIDYKTKKQNGQFIQLMFQLQGNLLNGIYNWENNQKGTMDLSDKKNHRIDIAIEDALSNTTNVSVFLRYTMDTQTTVPIPGKVFMVNKPNVFETPNIKLSLNEKALYDNFTFTFNSTPDTKSISDRYQIHTPVVPLHTYYDLQIKSNRALAFNLKDKIALVYTDGKNETGKAATAEGAWYKASVRNFGEYRLVLDTIPPVIKPSLKANATLTKASKINFVVTDETTSVKKFRGELDGKWICFEQHGDNFFYTFDEHCTKGKHKLVFRASDENGNTQIVNFNFTR